VSETKAAWKLFVFVCDSLFYPSAPEQPAALEPPPAPVQQPAAQLSKRRMDLPDDFLRVPGYRGAQAASSELSQMQQDEMFAKMLQVVTS
jgi:hypothetical protein